MQCVGRLLRERKVRTGQDRQPHDLDVLLDGDVGDGVRALPQPEIDNLEPGVAQSAGDELGAAVVTVETGLGDEDTDRHQNTLGCWNSPHCCFKTCTISPTVQYAFAQSTSSGMRFSPSCAAAFSSAVRVDRTSAADRVRLTSASRSSWRWRPFSSGS